ncbi:hypothetical protein OIU84_008961 [Salix udensis]|uniref:Uncharacterized protein n=1 Tax=Salix udensis TaxID=889485 RepID=A0AAD6JR04_9ROSI|nr:hypothetical protein OIU84_008961 [Salix udensis]
MQNYWFPFFVLSSELEQRCNAFPCKAKEGFRLQGQKSHGKVFLFLSKAVDWVERSVTLSLFLSRRWIGLFLDRMYGEYSVLFVVLAGDFILKSLWDHIRGKQVRVDFLQQKRNRDNNRKVISNQSVHYRLGGAGNTAEGQKRALNF